MRKLDSLLVPSILALAVANVFVWHSLSKGSPERSPALHFLDVGQGDSELMLFPGGVSILTDAGPDRKVVDSVSAVLPPDRHYIDIGIISHPQLDHYGGFLEMLRHYRFGAFIFNGREADQAKGNWNALLAKIDGEGIPRLVLGAGDRIRYGEAFVDFLSPSPKFLSSKELNDTAFVERIYTPSFSALLTADIGANVEKLLLKEKENLGADILKVGHHGSKFSSTAGFLEAVAPRLAVIEVGAKNTYRHPAPETLERLEDSSAQAVLRTDQHGTISVKPEMGKLLIFTQR